jgi:pimeloyl-ACP methyl ester carboxylesterase
MPEIKTNITSRLHYKKMGSGPVLVLLHGFPESHKIWRKVWPQLSQHYTLIMPDFPGSGGSLLESATSIEQMADCVQAILQHECIEQAVIAGHSMGGYTAFAFAAKYPELTRGLSVVHSSPAADEDEKKQTRLRCVYKTNGTQLIF